MGEDLLVPIADSRHGSVYPAVTKRAMKAFLAASRPRSPAGPTGFARMRYLLRWHRVRVVLIDSASLNALVPCRRSSWHRLDPNCEVRFALFDMLRWLASQLMARKFRHDELLACSHESCLSLAGCACMSCPITQCLKVLSPVGGHECSRLPTVPLRF
jgi:hypothetical protein